MPEKCFCCYGSAKELFSDKILSLNKCSACGSIIVQYVDSARIDYEDYYANEYFSNDKAVRSLLKTRLRQAKVISSRIIGKVHKDKSFIDFGSGYGVFIKFLRSQGYLNLEAIENSAIASSNLNKFVKSHLLRDLPDLLHYLEGKRDVDFLSALDVLEHFNPDELEQLIQLFSKDTVNIDNLIIKVPSCNGLLFIISFWLAKLKISNGFLYKMLQINAPPPHYIYFSKKGLKSFLLRHGFDMKIAIYDSDYELVEFGQRVTHNKLMILLINCVSIPLLACINFLFPGSRESIITLSANINFKRIV